MAVIGKIRERGGLLVGITLVSLALFILGDWLAGRGGGQRDPVIGTVDGEEVGMKEFERRVNEQVERYRAGGNTVNSQLQEQIRNSVWTEIVRESTLKAQAEEAGFGSAICPEELEDIRTGNNISPMFKNDQSLRDPATGQLNIENLRRGLKNLQETDPIRFRELNRSLSTERIYQKYTTLVKKSVYVNSAQAKDDYLTKNTKASFAFVAKRYDSEPDSLYTVADKDLRRYYDQHKNDRKYRQQAARKFEYTLFPVTPSEADRQATMEELAELRQGLLTSTDDSSYVVANSDSRMYNKTPYTEGTADKLNDSLIVHGAVGTVVGPYQQGDQWKLVKVTELADVPEARVRHILISTQNGKAEDVQKKLADSLLTVVKRDRSKFTDMVVKFSEDPGSNTQEKGGVYEWFDKQQMVPEFTTASFDEKVGAITIAKTSYGFHIVEVLGQRNRQERRVVTIERTMKPSPATFKEVYRKANEFSLRNADLASFKKAAEEQGLQVTPVDELRNDQRYVPGLQDATSVVTWVNRAEVGKPSEPIQSGDNYVVAILTGIRNEGAPQLDDVREIFTKEVVKEKKAEAWTAKMQGKTDLNALATELGTAQQNATDLTYSAFNLPGGFSESEVVGKVFALDNGQTSVPLKGETGVYVVSMTNKTAAPEPQDLNVDRKGLEQRAQSRVDGGLFNSLKEAAGVKDERYKYY
ncbi:MAG: peptidylprolyl isomerase [Flavobacteriales bacterium]|nr:peptidylprolyl isomerase [Flavobacteriales bacterium]